MRRRIAPTILERFESLQAWQCEASSQTKHKSPVTKENKEKNKYNISFINKRCRNAKEQKKARNESPAELDTFKLKGWHSLLCFLPDATLHCPVRTLFLVPFIRLFTYFLFRIGHLICIQRCVFDRTLYIRRQPNFLHRHWQL